MEQKLCKICENERPIKDFRKNRWGSYDDSCRECVRAKYRETRAAKRPQIGGGNIHDPEFDGKEPVEVIQIMTRAKRWLESRGYEIQLDGYYNLRKRIKFQ